MPVLQLFEYQENDVFTDVLQCYSSRQWNAFFECVQNKSTLSCEEASCEAARNIKNRLKNRYRNISPYDNSRVYLQSLPDEDYINASFVSIPEVPSRCYILTQSPMLQTVSHFWLMVWERRTPVIIMLNGMFEKGDMGLYFPEKSGHSSLVFSNVNLSVQLESETAAKNFIRRTFLLVNLKTSEEHRLLHLHYTKWPDFGVPQCPGDLLSFLWAVRRTGCLQSPDRPAVLHCSAGVGRSGCFVLIDLALLLIEQADSLQGLDLAALLVKLRHCRMGLIQTADQLRFCYLAVLSGGRRLLGTPPADRPCINFEEDCESETTNSPAPNDDDSESADQSSLSDDLEFHVISSDGEVEDDDDPIVKVATLATVEEDGDCEEHDDGNAGEAAVESEEALVSSLTQPGLVRRRLPSWRLTASDGDQHYSKEALHFIGRDHEMRLLHGDGSRRPMEEVPRGVDQLASVFTDISSENSGSLSSRADVQQYERSALGVEAEPRQLAGRQEDPPAYEQPAGTKTGHFKLVAAALELRERRTARRLRHLRNRNLEAAMRQRYYEAGLERRRWLPVWLQRPLRWFYCESGLVASPRGAVVATSLMLLAFLLTCLAVRQLYGRYRRL